MERIPPPAVLEEIISRFPPMSLAAAYGSGVFVQGLAPTPHPRVRDGVKREAEEKSTSSSSSFLSPFFRPPPPMIDFLFAVPCTRSWHEENLIRHPEHYSTLLRLMGLNTIQYLNERPAYLYYNTLIDMGLFSSNSANELIQHREFSSSHSFHSFQIKYGVISTSHLISDCLQWTSLYAAGRLHKPCRLFRSTPDVNEALSANLDGAVNAALLLLASPDQTAKATQPQLNNSSYPSPSASPSPSTFGCMFSPKQLYTVLASLSYAGDIRMGVAEDPNKVHNIVEGSYTEFEKLYTNTLKRNGFVQRIKGEGAANYLENAYQFQDFFAGELASPAVRTELFSRLPSNLRQTLQKLSGDWHFPSYSASDWSWLVKHPISYQNALLQQGLSSIVSQSSRHQTWKGLMTAGLSKAVLYGTRKLIKRCR